MPRTFWTCISSLLTHWHLPSPHCCRYPLSICQMQGHPCCTVYCIRTFSHEPNRLQYVLLCTATPHMRTNEVVVTFVHPSIGCGEVSQLLFLMQKRSIVSVESIFHYYFCLHCGYALCKRIQIVCARTAVSIESSTCTHSSTDCSSQIPVPPFRHPAPVVPLLAPSSSSPACCRRPGVGGTSPPC